MEGKNIRTVSGERVGQGRLGPKASGLLMVDGILYMWLRNADFNGFHSRLTWSEDHVKLGKTADWKFTESFGYPTFLNFGRDYQRARDDYVYVYSHDSASAYETADHMVLARVPKSQLTCRKAYEFFAGLDETGQSAWNVDIKQRYPVFTHPSMCYRSAVSYNTGLKRYLWSQVHPDSDDPRGPRFDGGFGIYEAPEPWGPWKTVFFTRRWDMGPGETASFPTKWMSVDGKSCYLVFSGEDCFSIRKVHFEVK